jgi:hypothetical protein
MRFAGLKNILKINLQLQLGACLGDVFMTSSWQLEVKMKAINIFETRKWIYLIIIRSMAVWPSAYVAIPLRSGGLGMDSHLSLVL